MTNDTSLKDSYALLLDSVKKNCKFAKIEFAKSSYVVKMLAKNCPKNDKVYIFENPLTMTF